MFVLFNAPIAMFIMLHYAVCLIKLYFAIFWCFKKLAEMVKKLILHRRTVNIIGRGLP